MRLFVVAVAGEDASSGGASGGGEGERVGVAPLMVEGRPHLPFQLQIEYTAQDGSRCMRVITQAKPITTNREVAEKGVYTCYHVFVLKSLNTTESCWEHNSVVCADKFCHVHT